MIHFKFSPLDNKYLFLKTDNTPEDIEVMDNLKSYLNLVDPICYLPTYNGFPKTVDFLYTYVQASGDTVYYCAIGLWQTIYQFLKLHNVEFDGLLDHQSIFKQTLPHTFDEFVKIVNSWGLKYTPRPYQYTAAYKILQWKSSLSQLATRAGKTLISYIVFRYAMEYMGVKNILMIVPAIDLVKQAYNDFKEYKEFFQTQCIFGGQKLIQSSNLTVGTFQSLILFLDKTSKRYNPHFFDTFDCLFVDEVHRANARQVRTIVTSPFRQQVKFAFGMTGTLPKEKSIESYSIHALLGAKIQTINPKELMDNNYISKILINQVEIEYDDSHFDELCDSFITCTEYAISDFKLDDNKKKIKLDNQQFLIQYEKEIPSGILEVKEKLRKEAKDARDFKLKYIDFLNSQIKLTTKTNNLVIEKMMVHFIDARLQYVLNTILPKCDRNTLILAHHTTYIEYVYEKMKEKFKDRHILMIVGKISNKKRDEIKKVLKENNDCILIASYGTMSTGITLANLFYGILLESFKSEVVNMQSLGRGLGLALEKELYTVYDIIDKFPKYLHTNKLYLQGLAKIRIYQHFQYYYKINKVKL